MSKCSGAGTSSLTIAQASCHLLHCPARILGPILKQNAGGVADARFLIFLATTNNLWQSIHHGKQRQRQARSKETEENHTQTPSGTPRCEPDPNARHQKGRRIDSQTINWATCRSWWLPFFL